MFCRQKGSNRLVITHACIIRKIHNPVLAHQQPVANSRVESKNIERTIK